MKTCSDVINLFDHASQSRRIQVNESLVKKVGTLTVSTLLSTLQVVSHFKVTNIRINKYFRISISFKKVRHMKKGSLEHNLAFSLL